MLKNLAGTSLVGLSLLLPTVVVANDKRGDGIETGNHDAGSYYVYWGWNRGSYGDSDVTFTGDDYDFTIKDMSASDRPTALGIDPYLNPLGMTLPQTNFKVGYFFRDRYAVSFGVDHMKYVMDQEQTATVDGSIAVGSEHDGIYNNESVYLGQTNEAGTPSFLAYEHTDGLNYVNVEFNRFDEFYAPTPKLKLTRILGAGVGLMYPRTNATLLTHERHDDYHISGWGAHINTGLELSYKQYFASSEAKLGYINMPDIRTTADSSDKASQQFSFTEWNILFGLYF